MENKMQYMRKTLLVNCIYQQMEIRLRRED